MTTVKFRYWSDKNISFKGEIDSGIEQEDWDQMPDRDKDEVENDLAADLVTLAVIER